MKRLECVSFNDCEQLQLKSSMRLVINGNMVIKDNFTHIKMTVVVVSLGSSRLIPSRRP